LLKKYPTKYNPINLESEMFRFLLFSNICHLRQLTEISGKAIKITIRR
ncbi:unnamed protein product, partial [marine sediment metagenome]